MAMFDFTVKYGYLSYDIPRVGYWWINAHDAKEAEELFYKYHIKGAIIEVMYTIDYIRKLRAGTL